MQNFILYPRPQSQTEGRLVTARRAYNCQLGRAGRRPFKREGDGATPIGSWRTLYVLYRGDRLARPHTRLPIKMINTQDGWCDEPLDRNYNRPVQLPYTNSAENLWRDDHAYDLIVVLDYNLSRRSLNKGSAIFMHLAHDDQRPTAGCLAFEQHDLRQILQQMEPGSVVNIP
ncbi:MAG: L,D-transpeptidase family protein [Hyphomicrobiaceae bacterium]|nr:L,D-transpeptidase family protein [Hyphomicrobiaceae bacterium]